MADCSALGAQCGGMAVDGAFSTTCCEGRTCRAVNEFFSKCEGPASTGGTTSSGTVAVAPGTIPPPPPPPPVVAQQPQQRQAPPQQQPVQAEPTDYDGSSGYRQCLHCDDAPKKQAQPSFGFTGASAWAIDGCSLGIPK